MKNVVNQIVLQNVNVLKRLVKRSLKHLERNQKHLVMDQVNFLVMNPIAIAGIQIVQTSVQKFLT